MGRLRLGRVMQLAEVSAGKLSACLQSLCPSLPLVATSLWHLQGTGQDATVTKGKRRRRSRSLQEPHAETSKHRVHRMKS